MLQDREFVQGLKTQLASRGLLREEEFQHCVAEAEQDRMSLIEVLYRSKKVPEKELVAVLSLLFGYPPFSPSTFTVDSDILNLLPRETAIRYQVLPIARKERTLTVAMVDPTNIAVLDDLHAISGLRIRPTLAPPTQLQAAIAQHYGKGSAAASLTPQAASSDSLEKIIQDIRSQVLDRPLAKEGAELSDLLEEANAAPVIRLVNQMLVEAIRRHASDVFIEPWEKTMRVRYRIDGVLEEILTIPRTFVEAAVSRIKVMSRLNIAEHRVPQDGRIKARIFGREIDIRVSILPTSHGEKACLRILDTGSQAQDLEKLGFSPQEMEIIRRLADRPHGMILVTGPTGSGKTTTLYAVLKYLNSPTKNITTVEDPVEYQVAGISQVNVRDQVGLTFPSALRSILRQDPDIILIGEIRDQTTMDIAIKAALTGHLVLSTLHTNDATSAIVRMINMGIEPFLIASSVLMISAQRLVRRLCPICREPYAPEPTLLETLGIFSSTDKKDKLVFYRPVGCNQCRFMGFKGRTVITEIFEMRPEIRDFIMRGATNEELRELARKYGMKTLWESGIDKIRQGATSLEEVVRVASAESNFETQGVSM